MMVPMGTSSLDDLYALDPVEFEHLVGTVFTALGYEVKVTKRSGDEGVDLDLRRGDERSIAQCKRYRGTVGQPAIRDFYGALVHEKAVRGYFVTTGQFSLAASTWAQGKPIALTDGVDLLSALEESGLLPEPRVKTNSAGRPTRFDLETILKDALKDPAADGRILLDGAPPDGHSYQEVANYLENLFPENTDTTTGSKLKGGSKLADWSESSALVRFIDEFDHLDRAAMERVLDAQRDGIRGTLAPEPEVPSSKNPELYIKQSERYRRVVRERSEYFASDPHRFVLVATRWEKRLPAVVRARFSTGIPVQDLDWSIFDENAASSPDSAARTYAEQKPKREEGWRLFEEAALVEDRTREACRNFSSSVGHTMGRLDPKGLEMRFVGRFARASVLDTSRGGGSYARMLPDAGRFEAVVMANDRILSIMAYWGEESESAAAAWDAVDMAIADMALHLRPGGVLIVSFQLIPDLLTVDAYDELAAQAGLVHVERWSNWECAPWNAASEYVVSVHRKPAEKVGAVS